MKNSELISFKDLGIGGLFRAYDSDQIIEFTDYHGKVFESFSANCVYKKVNNDTSWNALRQKTDGQWVGGCSFSSDCCVFKIENEKVGNQCKE